MSSLQSIISLRHTTHAKPLMRYHAEGCRRKYNGDVIPTGLPRLWRAI
jgi:hypothetical protein